MVTCQPTHSPGPGANSRLRSDPENFPQMRLTVLPITHGRWADLEAVFKAKGCSVARGCWCMAYRRSGAEKPLAAGTSRAEANRADLKALVDAGKAPGLIAYRGRVPVGWVSLAPREEFARLK